MGWVSEDAITNPKMVPDAAARMSPLFGLSVTLGALLGVDDGRSRQYPPSRASPNYRLEMARRQINPPVRRRDEHVAMVEDVLAITSTVRKAYQHIGGRPPITSKMSGMGIQTVLDEAMMTGEPERMDLMTSATRLYAAWTSGVPGIPRSITDNWGGDYALGGALGQRGRIWLNSINGRKDVTSNADMVRWLWLTMVEYRRQAEKENGRLPNLVEHEIVIASTRAERGIDLLDAALNAFNVDSGASRYPAFQSFRGERPSWHPQLDQLRRDPAEVSPGYSFIPHPLNIERDENGYLRAVEPMGHVDVIPRRRDLAVDLAYAMWMQALIGRNVIRSTAADDEYINEVLNTRLHEAYALGLTVEGLPEDAYCLRAQGTAFPHSTIMMAEYTITRNYDEPACWALQGALLMLRDRLPVGHGPIFAKSDNRSGRYWIPDTDSVDRVGAEMDVEEHVRGRLHQRLDEEIQAITEMEANAFDDPNRYGPDAIAQHYQCRDYPVSVLIDMLHAGKWLTRMMSHKVYLFSLHYRFHPKVLWYVSLVELSNKWHLGERMNYYEALVAFHFCMERPRDINDPDATNIDHLMPRDRPHPDIREALLAFRRYEVNLNVVENHEPDRVTRILNRMKMCVEGSETITELTPEEYSIVRAFRIQGQNTESMFMREVGTGIVSRACVHENARAYPWTQPLSPITVCTLLKEVEGRVARDTLTEGGFINVRAGTFQNIAAMCNEQPDQTNASSHDIYRAYDVRWTGRGCFVIDPFPKRLKWDVGHRLPVLPKAAFEAQGVSFDTIWVLVHKIVQKMPITLTQALAVNKAVQPGFGWSNEVRQRARAIAKYIAIMDALALYAHVPSNPSSKVEREDALRSTVIRSELRAYITRLDPALHWTIDVLTGPAMPPHSNRHVFLRWQRGQILQVTRLVDPLLPFLHPYSALRRSQLDEEVVRKLAVDPTRAGINNVDHLRRHYAPKCCVCEKEITLVRRPVNEFVIECPGPTFERVEEYYDSQGVERNKQLVEPLRPQVHWWELRMCPCLTGVFCDHRHDGRMCDEQHLTTKHLRSPGHQRFLVLQEIFPLPVARRILWWIRFLRGYSNDRTELTRTLEYRFSY